jgi:hypothetical protein
MASGGGVRVEAGSETRISSAGGSILLETAAASGPVLLARDAARFNAVRSLVSSRSYSARDPGLHGGKLGNDYALHRSVDATALTRSPAGRMMIGALHRRHRNCRRNRRPTRTRADSVRWPQTPSTEPWLRGLAAQAQSTARTTPPQIDGAAGIVGTGPTSGPQLLNTAALRDTSAVVRSQRDRRRRHSRLDISCSRALRPVGCTKLALAPSSSGRSRAPTATSWSAR